PSPQHNLQAPGPKARRPRVGIRPRYSGLRVQGTATSPPSTATGKSLWELHYIRLENGVSRWKLPCDRVNPLLVGKGETSRPTKDGLVLAAVHHCLQDPSECGRASFESR